MSITRRAVFGTAAVGAAAASSLSLAPQIAEASPPRVGVRVRTGADVQAAKCWADLKGRKLGIITNPTGVLGDLTSIVDSMAAAGLDIKGVFGPEHGFRGTAQAGDAEGTSIDPRTGLTVYDFYNISVDKMASYYQQAGVDTIVRGLVQHG